MRTRVLVAAVLFAIAGCGGDEEAAPPAPAEQPPQQPEQPADERVRKLGAADAVGYDGAGIQRSVQRTLDTAAEQQRRAEEARKSAAAP